MGKLFTGPAALFAVLALAACGGSAPQSRPASPLTAARALYCADLTILHGDFQLAGTDPVKYGASELTASSRLSDDAGRFQAAGDVGAAGKVRQLALMLSLDGQAHQQANPDPQLLARIGEDTASALRAAPACPQ